MKFGNKEAVLVQIAPLFICQSRNQNQSIETCGVWLRGRCAARNNGKVCRDAGGEGLEGDD